MARILDSVVGHEEIILNLVSAIAAQRMPPQLVFYGPEGIGKKKVALGLIQILFCESRQIGQSSLACGDCGSCRRVELGTAENLLTISPEKNLIKIEQSHKILEFLSLQAWSTQKSNVARRAVLIEEAHTLNTQAANALLKVFEEPPENTFFFLITHRHRMLLPTIRSRAKMLGFHPLTTDQIQKVYPQVENWKLLSSRGSFQKLLSLDDPSDIRKQSVDCLMLLLKKPDEFIISNWRDQLKDREVAAQYLRWWMLFLRDATVLNVDFSHVISQDQMPLVELLKTYSQEKIHALFTLLLKSESALWSYQDPILLIESIFLSGFYHVGDEVYVD
jgi:DNA polymerase-3 subunit delta'